MAVMETKINIHVEHTRYAFIFFPIATYTKVNEISLLTVFRIPIYQSTGKAYKWLWFKSKERN